MAGIEEGYTRPRESIPQFKHAKKEVLEALREMQAFPDIRLIPVVDMPTSYGEEDILGSFVQAANSYMTKPITFDALVKTALQFGACWLNIFEMPRISHGA